MITIREMQPADGEAVLRIYQEGIETGQATFQSQAPTWEEWNKSHLEDLRFVALYQELISGWVALSPVSSRCVYAGVAEVSVYVGNQFRGKQIGSSLLQTIVAKSEGKGYWTLQAGIFPENTASIALHKKCGFRVVGERERVGKMNGVWRSTVLLERRSLNVGVD
jgi:L-amino acid N-acyltransferase YncA